MTQATVIESTPWGEPPSRPYVYWRFRCVCGASSAWVPTKRAAASYRRRHISGRPHAQRLARRGL